MPRLKEADTVDGLRAEVARLTAALARAEQALADVQIRDRVTGLLDQRETLRRVRVEIDRCRRHRRTLSVIVVSIVGYPALVERTGRRGADQLLLRAGQVCAQGRRLGDVVGRLEGGEFAVQLPEVLPAGALTVIDHIRRANQASTGLVELPSGASVSLALELAFGVAHFPEHGSDVDTLLAVARSNLQSA